MSIIFISKLLSTVTCKLYHTLFSSFYSIYTSQWWIRLSFFLPLPCCHWSPYLVKWFCIQSLFTTELLWSTATVMILIYLWYIVSMLQSTANEKKWPDGSAVWLTGFGFDFLQRQTGFKPVGLRTSLKHVGWLTVQTDLDCFHWKGGEVGSSLIEWTGKSW